MKKIITIAIAVLLSVLALVIAGRMRNRSSDEVVSRSTLTDGTKVMVTQKHASDGATPGDEKKPMSVTFHLPEGWMFDAYPDGSICGQLGSDFGDSVLLPRGTVDFSDIVKIVETAIETKTTDRKAVHAAVRYEGGSRSVTSKPIEDNGFFRRLFLMHRNSWRNYKGNISPKEVEELLQFIEYYKEADNSTEQPATSPESKSQGGDKPQPDAEGRSR